MEWNSLLIKLRWWHSSEGIRWAQGRWAVILCRTLQLIVSVPPPKQQDDDALGAGCGSVGITAASVAGGRLHACAPQVPVISLSSILGCPQPHLWHHSGSRAGRICGNSCLLWAQSQQRKMINTKNITKQLFPSFSLCATKGIVCDQQGGRRFVFLRSCFCPSAVLSAT